jgi:predicted nucleotidyltransferase
MGSVLEDLDRDRLAELCRRHDIARLALFGSAARGQLGPESDIDLLVEFVPGRRVGLRFITVQEELEALLGRKVDLNTRAFLSPYFRDRVEAEALPLYEAA